MTDRAGVPLRRTGNNGDAPDRPTLLLIDGHNLLFQMFFGMPARIRNKEGKAIQGTLGFTGALLGIVRRVSPTHLLVLFDGEHPNGRAELDPAYKANRVDYTAVPDDDNPFSQLPDIVAALDFMGIRHAETTDGETDDAIAGYVGRYRGRIPIVISSLDSGFFQLIGKTVTVLRYRGEHTVLCDTAYVLDRFGVSPGLFADFKALVGDPSDNIKGADRVGPKTAAALLHRFGGLEEILQDADTIGQAAVRASIQASADRLRMNARLIRLRGGGALPFDIGELAYQDSGMTTNEVLAGIGLK